jgi:hypothetical protein
MTIDDINDQFAFGQLKVAEKDGQPVYIQTNKAGQTKVADVPEGVKPTDKEFSGTSKADKAFQMKASDSNSIRAASAGIYGGTWDPQTGKVLGVSKDQTKNVAAISERASKVYRDAGGNMTHDEAVAKAARELGIDIPKIAGGSLKDWLDKTVGPK